MWRGRTSIGEGEAKVAASVVGYLVEARGSVDAVAQQGAETVLLFGTAKARLHPRAVIHLVGAERSR